MYIGMYIHMYVGTYCYVHIVFLVKSSILWYVYLQHYLTLLYKHTYKGLQKWCPLSKSLFVVYLWICFKIVTNLHILKPFL
jgi:hypothetical protein